MADKVLALINKHNRLVKFLTIGASGAVLSLTILFTCTEFIGLHYLLSYGIAIVIVVTTNYILNSIWTFNDKKSSFAGLGKYAMVSLGTLALRELMLFVLTDIFGLWYMLGACIVISITCLMNFGLSRRLVWNTAK